MAELAEKYNIKFTAKLPIDPKLAELVDAGKIEEFEGGWLDEITEAVKALPVKEEEK